jgi:hypothetical protein
MLGYVTLLCARTNIKVSSNNQDLNAHIKIVLRAIEQLNLLHKRAVVSNAGEEPSVAKRSLNCELNAASLNNARKTTFNAKSTTCLLNQRH